MPDGHTSTAASPGGRSFRNLAEYEVHRRMKSRMSLTILALVLHGTDALRPGPRANVNDPASLARLPPEVFVSGGERARKKVSSTTMGARNTRNRNYQKRPPAATSTKNRNYQKQEEEVIPYVRSHSHKRMRSGAAAVRCSLIIGIRV